MLDPVLRASEEARRGSRARSDHAVHRVDNRVVVNIGRDQDDEQDNGAISAFGNVLWIFLGGGLVIFLGYLLGGIIQCVTIIGIPFGIQNIKLAMLGLMPFTANGSSTANRLLAACLLS